MNLGPLDLQSNALPLSYTPYVITLSKLQFFSEKTFLHNTIFFDFSLLLSLKKSFSSSFSLIVVVGSLVLTAEDRNDDDDTLIRGIYRKIPVLAFFLQCESRLMREELGGSFDWR